MANENQDPYGQAYWGKNEGKKGKNGKSKFQYPYEWQRKRRTREREIQDVRSHRREDGPPFSRLRHPQSLHMPVGHGTAQAMMAFHDAYEQHEKDATHEKLIQADAVSEQ